MAFAAVNHVKNFIWQAIVRGRPDSSGWLYFWYKHLFSI